MPWPYFHAQPLLWPPYFSPKMPGQPKRENLLTKPWVVEYGDIQIVCHRHSSSSSNVISGAMVGSSC